MKRYLFILIIILMSVPVLQAQSFKANHPAPAKRSFSGHKVYIGKFSNTGNARFNEFGNTLAEKFKSTVYAGKVNWPEKQIYVFVDSKNEADVIVEGNYQFHSDAARNVENKLVKEPHGEPFRLSYTVASYNFSNTVNLDLAMTLKNQKGEVLNEIHIADTLVKREKKDVYPPEIESTTETESAFQTEALRSIPKSFMITAKEDWVDFEKLSVKDKALKEEYKNVKSLLNEGNFVEAGKIFKKIYENDPDPLAAFNLALCYEFAGNYEKAAEYYKIKFDFPSKKRMENNMVIWEMLPDGFKRQAVVF